MRTRAYNPPPPKALVNPGALEFMVGQARPWKLK